MWSSSPAQRKATPVALMKKRIVPAPTRSAGGHVLARDAEVDLPGWGSPLIGDDDSDVTFTPSADFRTPDFERDISALANEDYLAQFYRQELGRKAGEYDDSSMSERGGYQGALRIKAGTKGVVRIAVHAHFFFDEKWNNTYDQYFACSWEVTADLKGKLQIESPVRRSRPSATTRRLSSSLISTPIRIRT